MFEDLLKAYRVKAFDCEIECRGKIHPVRILAHDLPGAFNAFVAIRTDTEGPTVMTFDRYGLCGNLPDIRLKRVRNQPKRYRAVYRTSNDSQDLAYESSNWAFFNNNVQTILQTSGWRLISISSED